MSFKYGDKLYEKDERLFQCYTEESLENLLLAIGFIKETEMWVTQDIRKNRPEEKWLNAIALK
jgi:hypothetical protein